MQRAARFLLWGGLALLILSMASCGIGCVSIFGSAKEGTDATGGGPIALGMFSLLISTVMLIVGALLKALAPTSSEDR